MENEVNNAVDQLQENVLSETEGQNETAVRETEFYAGCRRGRRAGRGFGRRDGSCIEEGRGAGRRFGRRGNNS